MASSISPLPLVAGALPATLLPVTGRVLMSANRLTGVIGTRKNWRSPAWTWTYQPVAHVGYAHFLFDIRSGLAGAAPCTARQRPPS